MVVHPYLLAVFPVLFAYTHNFEKLLPLQFFQTTVVMLVFAILLMVATRYLLIKDARRAGFIVSLFLIIFFTYGHVYNAITKLETFTYLRHRYLLAPVLLFFTVVFFLVLRTRRKFETVTIILNIFSLVLIVITLIGFGYTNIIMEKFADSSIEDHDSGSIKSTLSDNYPDIYYIVVDGHTGKEELEKEYAYSNKEFYDYLISKGFYIVENAKSNYSETVTSMPSTLNMEYINSFCDYSVPDLRTKVFTRRAAKALRDNKVLQFLKSRGYKYIHFASGNSISHYNDNADVSIVYGYLTGFHYLLMRTSILLPIAPHFIQGAIGKRVLYNFEKLGEVPKIIGPKFVFVHILSPHPPYFTSSGEDGEARHDKAWDVSDQKRLYLEQVMLVDKLLKQAVEKILLLSKKPPVIIIQSDHGGAYQYEKRSFLNKKLLDERMNIINAYYLEGKKAPAFFRNIMSVNTFRAVFNVVFGTDYQLLDNKSYYSEESGGPCDFREIIN